MSYDLSLWHYNCQDCCYTFEIAESLRQTVKALNLQAPHDFQQRLLSAVFVMMERGIRYDLENRDAFEKMLLQEIQTREEWITKVLGHSINIKSNLQMKKLFYGDFQQKEIKNRKTGAASLDDKSLTAIMLKETLLLPLVKKIQELRSLGVFLSTFVRAPVDSDGRMRSSFNITGTETFRFSSRTNAFGTGMNLQNIPKGGTAGDPTALDLPNVRSLFIPDEGYEICDIDLASADLRVVMWEAEESTAKEWIKSGIDFYTMLMRMYMKDDTLPKSHPLRQKFKAVAHATHYLGKPKGIAANTGLALKEIEEVQKWYFANFPGVKRYQERIIDDCKTKGYIQNIFGNRWYIFDRIDDAVFRQAAAWLPQSTVALIINRALVNIHENSPKIKLLSQVHDSLVMEYPIKDAEECKVDIIKQASIELPYPGDSLIIPVGLKTSQISWGDCD